MGKAVQQQAEELGFTNFPLTVLYARPRYLRPAFATTICDTVDVVRLYLRELDSSIIEERSGGTRNTTHYFLAPQIKIYVELISKTIGRIINNPANHANEIKIYSKFKAHVINITSRLDAIFPDGMLRHMDWEKVEDTFIVFRQDCIRTWRANLAELPERQRPTEEEMAKLESEQAEIDEEVELEEFEEEDQAKKYKKLFDKYRD